MTKVSRIPLDRQIEFDLKNDFWHALGKLNKAEVELLFREILSPTEIIMLAKRLEILKQLLKKYRYQDIKESIRVTEPTIAKVSLTLQRSSSHFRDLVIKLIKDDKRRWEEFKNKRKPQWRGRMIFSSK